MIICEEMAFMDTDVVHQVVFPTMVKAGSVFIAISSAGEAHGFFERMIEMRDPEGRPVMHTIRITGACDDCIAAGRAESCAHKIGTLPPWHQKSKHDKLKMLMSDQIDLYLRESRNIQGDPNIQPAFERAALDELARPARLHTNRLHIDYLFVTIDPSGGGTRSRYAVVSCVYREGRMIIVGAEEASYREPMLQVGLLVRHVRRVLKLDGFQTAIPIIVPESNLALEAKHTENLVQNAGVRGWHFMHEDHNGAGVRTDNALKHTMAMALGELLNRGAVYFLDRFVTVDKSHTAESMRAEILSQLRGYMRIVEPPRKSYHTPKEFYTGKQSGGFDDIAIALQLNPIMERAFFAQPDRYGHIYKPDPQNAVAAASRMARL